LHVQYKKDGWKGFALQFLLGSDFGKVRTRWGIYVIHREGVVNTVSTVFVGCLKKKPLIYLQRQYDKAYLFVLCFARLLLNTLKRQCHEIFDPKFLE
jgi:hypothetical protein